jgi:hypothetical protein
MDYDTYRAVVEDVYAVMRKHLEAANVEHLVFRQDVIKAAAFDAVDDLITRFAILELNPTE